MSAMIKIFGRYITKYHVEGFIFSRIARFKRCRSCFRCEEKGSRRRHFLDDISVKPAKDAVVHCCSACSPDIHGDQYHAACEWYEPRWYWNLKQRLWTWRYYFGRWWCENIRMKIGALRRPVAMEWEDGLDCCGQYEPKSVPKCPHCGEMPYSYTQCQFCGQRFLEVKK